MTAILNSPLLTVIRAVIDIVIVAYVFYFLYSVFENTQTISVIKGFILIVGIYFLAKFLGLKTIEWIFKYVVNYIVIIGIILFQPEIRKLFLQVGGKGIAMIKISPKTIQEIEKAIFRMSESKTGALILIEQSVGLRDLRETGYSIDAKVQSEILESIFFKNSIMHDGAVIIQGDRVIAAKVIIPNVSSPARNMMKKNLGTRHRAAIQASNDTDAVAIIVSEETGKVSIAYNAKLNYDLSKEKFEELIHEYLEKNSKDENNLTD